MNKILNGIFTKIEKILLLTALLVYIGYLVFLGFTIRTFNSYVGDEYLRGTIVEQIREQTKLTQDSANISTKDLNYIFEIMGKLSYLYVAMLVVLLVILVLVLLSKKINKNILGFVLLVYSVFLLIMSIGILFITSIIFFFLGIVVILRSDNKLIISKQ